MRAALLTAALACACSAAAPRPAVTTPPAPQPPAVLPGEREALGRRPQPARLAPFEAPVPHLERLPNGLAVYVVERPGDGLEAVQLWIRGGAGRDPAAQPGLFALTAALLETGAAGRSQTALAAAADAIGATLSTGATHEAVVVAGSAASSEVGPLVGLVSDLALRPDFPAAEFSRVRELRISALVAEAAEPELAAQRNLLRAVYAGTPLGHTVEGSVESLQAVTLNDVRRAYASFSPADAAIVAVGGAPAAVVLRSVSAAFAPWTTRAGPHPLPLIAPPAARPRLVFTAYPAKPQSVVVVGQPVVARSSPHYQALEVLNAILGGSFTSRLNQNLREKHGYGYGAGSHIEWAACASLFRAGASVKTDVTSAALGELLGELRRALEPVEPAELEKGRALLVYRMVEMLSHADALAPEVARLWLYGLPADEFRREAERLQALTPRAVQEAARAVLRPEAMTVSIAGDPALVLPQLAPLGLGAPQLRDAAGRVLREPSR